MGQIPRSKKLLVNNNNDNNNNNNNNKTDLYSAIRSLFQRRYNLLRMN